MKCQITCQSHKKDFEISADESLLEAAIKAQMHPPYSCLEGICGTCHAFLEAGQVDQEGQLVKAPREIRTCISRPKSDVAFNYDKS